MLRDPFTPERTLLRSILRQARRNAGLRQVDLAERLGMPQSFVSRYESGERRLDLPELRLICAALGIPLQELVAQFEEALAQSKSKGSLRE